MVESQIDSLIHYHYNIWYRGQTSSNLGTWYVFGKLFEGLQDFTWNFFN